MRSTRIIDVGVIAALSIALLLGAPYVASATPSTPEIEAKRLEVDGARAKMENLADRAELRREELLEAIEALEDVRGQIDETRDELFQARSDQAAAESTLAHRAGSIYRSGGTHLLEVLLGTTSFEDFLTRVEWFRRVNRSDAMLVLNVKEAVGAVESAERALERREVELASLRSQAEVKAREVEEALSAQEQYVANLDREVATLVAAEEERLRREAEERARRAAEEAARRAAEEAARAAAEQDARATPEQSDSPSASSRTARPHGRTFDSSSLGPGNPEAVVVGMRYLGVPYVWGGSTPAGFDCSGLTQYVYRDIGISIPRNSRMQFTVGAYIPPDRLDLLLPGDLVFFGYEGNPDRVHHVGIFVGGGDYLHAPSTGRPVQVESLTSRIDRRGDYVGATRP